MRFEGLLNSILIGELSALGHTDIIVIADAGFPIPLGPKLVDLSIIPGYPSVLQLCDIIGIEIPIDSILIAEEMQYKSPNIFEGIKIKVKEWECKNRGGIVPINITTHAKFKEISKNARVVIKTGEFSPYSNTIIYSGCAF